MKHYITGIFLGAVVLLAATMLTGVYYYVISDQYFEGKQTKTSSIVSVSDNWEYTDERDRAPEKVQLPAKLLVDSGVNRIILENTLPEFRSQEFILRFPSSNQTVQIYIGDQLRYEYGYVTENLFDYMYLAASNINKIELKPEDRGKELKIVLEAPDLFRSELGLVRDVEIGTSRDFLENDMIYGSSSVFVSAITMAVGLVLLCMALIMFPMKQTFKLLTSLALLALLWVFFFCSDSELIWNLMDYSPRYAAINDWKFYIMDAFMPIVSYKMFLLCSGLRLKKTGKWLIAIHISLYVMALILNLTQVVSINLFRAVFMVLSAGIYIYLVIQCKKQKTRFDWSAAAVLIALAGYYLDYIKYCISLLPLSTELIIFLQLELSFMSFLGFALIAYSILMVVGVAQLYNRQRMESRQQGDRHVVQMELAQIQYEKMKSNYETLRQIRHDMQHHFRVLDGYLAENNTEETRDYLHGMMHSVEALQLSEWCKSYAANITIGWFENQAKEKEISFTGEADIPQEAKSASGDLCAVLSNGLQNAIEACDRMEAGQPCVFLNAYPAGDALVIRIRNTFNGILVQEGGVYRTTKERPGHGIGLSSITSIVEKRDGYMSVSSTENLFTLEVVLNHMFE